MDAGCRVALAAYLHDLGKFAERAAIADAEAKDAQGNSKKDIHKQEYCPSFNNRYSHVHAAYTAIAMDLLEPYLPDIKSGDCSPFASWTQPDGLAHGDSLINAAARHHKPETCLQWIIASADRMASGFERCEFDLYNRAEEGGPGRSHVTARMEVLLEKISLSDAVVSHEFRYALAPLCPESLMPKKRALCEPESNDNGRKQYHDLWQGFIGALKKADNSEAIPTSHKKDLSLWLDHFDSLWMTFTHAIPSATASKVDGKFIAIPADVSLYDHSRTTAALAVALWRWHQANNAVNDNSAASLRLGKDEKIAKFLLVQGDMAGIQDFIFASGGSTQKYAAKILRGRSFMVSLLAEVAALQILEALGLPPTSQVINAAGKFLIVAPNTPDVVARLAKAKSAINHWFLEKSQGRAGLSLAWIAAAPEDFRHGDRHDSPFANLMNQLFALLDVQKLQRLSLCDAETTKIFENYTAGFSEFGECPLDAYSAAACDHNGLKVSRLAKDQIRIGESLADPAFNRILITRQPVNSRHTLATDFFGFYVTFTNGEEITGKFGPLVAEKKLLRAWDYSLPESASAPLWSGYAKRFINGYVATFDQYDGHLPEKYRRLPDDTDFDNKAGALKPLDCLADEDRFLDSGDDRASFYGISALHTLKGDVDNLGLIFQQGLSRPTFAKMASLSRQMNAFFAIWLPWRCRKDFKNTYTVFAGGDDFFLMGPWKSQMRLAQVMQQDFANYVAGNADIHFSAGMYLSKPGLPIRQTGDSAEAALEAAKQYPGKNAVTCFGKTVSWPQFSALMQMSGQFAEMKQDFGLSSGFIYGLLQLIDMAANEHKKPENALWRSWLTYRVQRHIGDCIKRGSGAAQHDPAVAKEQNKLLVQTLIKQFAGDISKYGATYCIALYLHLYQYRT
jgi:CRISPR-associated protein Csm1